MEKCWESHAELKTEENLGLMKNQVWLYQEDILRILGVLDFMVQRGLSYG